MKCRHHGAPAVVTDIVRSGTYAVRHSGTGATDRGLAYTFKSANSNGPFFVRTYFRAAQFQNSPIMVLADDPTSISTDRRAWIALTSSGTLTLNDEDGQIGAASVVIAINTLYLIEIEFDTTGAAGSHVVKAKLNGVEFASATNRSISTGVDNLLLQSSSGATLTINFDDLAINDSSGSFQNSYPGQGKIIHLRPNAAGDNTAWTGAYTDVDEVTPDDTTTKLSSNTLDQIEDMNIDSPTMMGDQDTVNVVAVGVRFNGVGASANASFVLRIKASASGTVEESSAITPSNTTYVTNAAAAPRNYSLVLYDLPGASTTAWTKNDLEQAQIGVRLSATSTNAAQVSTIWASVDYTPVTVKKWGVKPR